MTRTLQDHNCKFAYQQGIPGRFLLTQLAQQASQYCSTHGTTPILLNNHQCWYWLALMHTCSVAQVRSNVGQSSVNAVTWGVFPGKEVVQPTVVDPHSFSVWKVHCLASAVCVQMCTAVGPGLAVVSASSSLCPEAALMAAANAAPVATQHYTLQK